MYRREDATIFCIEVLQFNQTLTRNLGTGIVDTWVAKVKIEIVFSLNVFAQIKRQRAGNAQ